MRLALIGNPENRRVRDFAAVWSGELQVLAYEDLLRDPSPLRRLRADVVRLDSPGENPEVSRLLCGAALEHGEIARLREYHLGYLELLEKIRFLPCLNAPEEVAVMFDKWLSHERFAAGGLPRPASQPATRALLQAPQGRLFLKPLHGSSASGVCALRWSGERRELWAPLTLENGRLFNNLRVRCYTRRAEVDAILDALLPQGMIAEHWIPKLSLPGGCVDLRVLVIAGEARHRVVRQSTSPMTNLHLGNRRGDEAQVRAAVGEEKWEAALRLAERAAACFPRSLSAGVDILLDTSGRALVGEINAFGDLLPGLAHRGQTAYQAIAEAARARSFAV